MIVLSVGMPRAGSGWHYNLIHDLMKASGSADAHDIRRRFHLEEILTEVNCNIGALSARRLLRVAIPALLGNTFVIKAHAGPTRAARVLLASGLLRITYIYRDPRDAMLSASDYGERSVVKGRPNAFAPLTTFDQSVKFMMEYVRIWAKWMAERNVLIARYEDLLTNYAEESAKLVAYLKLDARRPEVRAVVEQYRPSTVQGQQGLHYFKGQIGRFREAYSEEQRSILSQKLAEYLPRMGYSL